MSLTRRDYWLLGASLVFALVYTYALQWGLYPAKPFLKAPVILLLAVFVFFKTQGRTRLLLSAALLLSCLGDVFLALAPGYFVHGLVSFLIAHLFYIALFLTIRRPGLTVRDAATAAALTLYGLALVTWLYPNLGAMTGPVVVYAAVLLGMGFSASLCDLPRPVVFWGALIFIASDSGIATNKFVGIGDWLGYLTWITYVVAQYLIVFGITSRAQREPT